MAAFRAGAIAALLMLSGCTHVSPDPTTSGDGCCSSPERRPRWLVAVVEPFAPIAGNIIGRITWRRGHLADPTIEAEIMPGLRPLDLVGVSSKGRLSGHTIPGLFQHIAVYLGTEADIRGLGIWFHPQVVPHHGAFRKGPVFIEADQKGVHLSPPSVVLNTDRVVSMRPMVDTSNWRRRAALTLFVSLGEGFDFNFDAADGRRLFCAELACHAIPELKLPRDRLYGRDTILPDRVVEVAAKGGARLQLMTYLVGDRDGWSRADRRRLRLDLDAEWSR